MRIKGGLINVLKPLLSGFHLGYIEADAVAVEFDSADHVFHFGSMDWEPNIKLLGGC